MFALRFLAGDYSWEPVSWCTATHLGRELEVDFAALHRGEDEHRQVAQTLLLGEAKSFNRFEERDVSRLHALRRRFPEATLVAATLRPSLDADERAALRALSQPPVRRPSDVSRGGRLIVLTGLELFHRGDPPECWDDIEGSVGRLVDQMRYSRPTVRMWADVTAMLHLGAEPHDVWARAQLERLRDEHERR